MSPPNEPFRVSVFPQDSSVRDRVVELLEGVVKESTHVYEGVVDGWADQASLDRLHEMGVSVVVPRATAAPSTEPPPIQAQAGVEAAPAAPGAAADGGGVGVDPKEAAAPAAEEPLVLRRSKWLEPGLRETLQWLSTTVPDEEKLPEDVMEVYLREAIREEWRETLAQQGDIRSEITPTVIEMRIAADRMAAVSALPYVQSIRRAGIATTVTPALLDALQGVRQAAAETADGAADGAGADLAPADVGLAGDTEPEAPPAETFDVVLHTPDTMAEVKAMLAERDDVEVVGESATTLRFRAPVDPVLVARLGKVTGVKSLSTYTAPVLFCDHVRTLLGIQFPDGNGGGTAVLEWDGTGQVVGIVDSGVDGGHPGLAGQVREAFAVPGAFADDRVGHGTHVASIIAGTGKYRVTNGAGAEEEKEGPVRGIAPGARLVCLGIVDEHGTLKIDSFVDLGDLLKLAVEKGAKILNLSWGSAVGGSYDHGSESVDRFVYEHPDVLVVIAAGNFGEWDTERGDLRFNTVAAPASAKNVLTVGASATDRAEDTFGG
ncbi:Subtilase family protein, partial [bacterium JGI 053]